MGSLKAGGLSTAVRVVSEAAIPLCREFRPSVTLKAHSAADLARFDAAVAMLPQIVESSHVSGAFDYLLKVVVADLPEWTRITEELTGGDVGADRINTHVLLRKPKVFVGYPINAR